MFLSLKMNNLLCGPPLPANFWDGLNQKSIDSYILDYIRHNEDRVYMINGETNEQLTLRQLSEQSLNVATNLQSLGCRSSQTNVAIFSENHINFMVAHLGIWLSGSTATTVNCLYTNDELKHAMNIAKPSILICSLQTYPKAKGILATNQFVKYLILLDNPPILSTDVLLFSDLSRKSSSKLVPPCVDPNDPAQILFSSGTTGLPKGVLLTHKNIVYMIHMINLACVVLTEYSTYYQLEGKYTLTTLPMFHAFGMFVNLFTLTLDMTEIFLKRFDEELYLSLIQKYKIKSLFLVPPMVVSLLKSDLIKQYDLSSVDHIVCGGATLKFSTEKEIVEKLNLNRCQQGYALTESGTLVTLKHPSSQKVGSCGNVVPGVVGKVIDTETSEILGPGQMGELCFNTPGMMKGYSDDPEATASAIRDGWLHTGDLGYYDEDGDFFVVDRLKELIKYKAYQVAPAELEALLIKHPEIKDAGVIGVPDDAAGELPTAFVVRKPQSSISENDLKQYVSDKVSPHKWLRGGVRFVDEIPKNSSGKILRRKLRELAANEITCKY
ncbi:uncharacterized protein LOC135846750 [Planococcus citri]|uniref:uncharacterized protein LOC135846750 n=1 Tax=Planococcus citri TaxID=170843 RepID=UPI0031F74877